MPGCRHARRRQVTSMPELPEVEVIRRGLAPVLVGRRFLAVQVGAQRLRQQSSPQELRRWLLGRRLEGLRRRGKYLVFDLEGGVTLLIHLGMTGHLLLGPPPPLPCPTFTWCFSWKADWSCFSRISGASARSWSFHPGRSPAPGPGGGRAVLPESDPGLAGRAGPGPVRPIKNFLMDARIMAGIGNIYACEILWASRLHPATPGGPPDPR